MKWKLFTEKVKYLEKQTKGKGKAEKTYKLATSVWKMVKMCIHSTNTHNAFHRNSKEMKRKKSFSLDGCQRKIDIFHTVDT